MNLKVSLYLEYVTLVSLPEDHFIIKRKQKSHEILSHLGNIWMLHTVTYVCVCAFLCAYVFCFTLKDRLHCQPIWGKIRFKSLKLHIRGITAPLPRQRRTARPRSCLQPLGIALSSYFRKAKQLERCEFSYNSLFDTDEAKCP